MIITGSTGDVSGLSPLVRYVAAATLARGADGAAAVGLVLVATSADAGLANAALVGGLLATGLTAPHLFGPWVARGLDRARDGRRLLAAAFALYGLTLAAAALLLGRAPLTAVAVPVLLAGLCGPLLTGGLSSRLSGIAGRGKRSQRRAQGWDAVSYGLGGSAGPALVAVLAAAATPVVAVVALGAAAVLAAGWTLTLPRRRTPPDAQREPLPVRAALRLMAVHGALRRAGVATMLTGFSTGALSVIAVLFGHALSPRPGAGATLAAMFGLGNLAGALLVTAFPLRGEPEALMTRHAVLMGLALALCAAAPGYVPALAAFALAGAANAPFFTATLAARCSYAPEQARTQVFVSMAGLKVAAASAGTAVAGATVACGPRALLAAGAAITVAAAAATALDRRLAR